MAYLYAGFCTLGVFLLLFFWVWLCEHKPELGSFILNYLFIFAFIFCVFMAFYQLFI